MREIVNAIAFATRPRALLDGDQYRRSRRPSASAGALHPVDLLLVHPASRVFRYDPMTHCLQRLRIVRQEPFDAFITDCSMVLPQAGGTALVLVGDLARVDAVYDNPASLLWRDAGALLQTLGLVSAVYRLAFCPVGILGGTVVRALELPPRAVALGVAIIGRTADA